MELRKLLDTSQSGGISVGQSELFTIHWNNGENPDFYRIDANRKVHPSDKHAFLLATIGEHYSKIDAQLPSPIHHYVTTKDAQGNIYFSLYKEETLYGFTPEGKQILNWTPNEIGNGHPTYDIAFQEPDLLWLAFPSGGTVTQVSLSQRKEIFRIGDYPWEEQDGPLNYPESITVIGEYLLIPNMGNNKLFQLHIPSKELQLLTTFEQGIWQYAETDFGTFVVLDNGIYEIVSGMPFR